MRFNVAQQLSTGKEDHLCNLLSSRWEEKHFVEKSSMNLF